jgi:hypothetical protein
MLLRLIGDKTLGNAGLALLRGMMAVTNRRVAL